MMNHRPRRILVASLSLLLLAACSVALNFDITKVLNVKSTSTTLTPTIQLVDLTTQSEVQAHKANIKALSLEAVDVQVTTLNAGNKATKLINATLSLRPDGLAANDTSQDILVGTLTNVSITAGNSVHIAGSTAVDTFVFNTLQGSGKFDAIFSGSTDDVADVVLTATLHASMLYDTGIL